VLLIVIAAGVAVGIVQASFFEWTFHRYWLHRPWQPKDCFTTHTLIHHQLCKFEDTFEVHEEEQHEALHFQWWGGPALILINTAPWAGLAWWLHAAGSPIPGVAFVITFVSTVLVYYLGYEGFHFLMHKPMMPWIEQSRWFLFLKKHHKIHHVHMDRNLNVLLPLADLILGTLVRETVMPVTTPPTARTLARRHSRFGRRLEEQESRRP